MALSTPSLETVHPAHYLQVQLFIVAVSGRRVFDRRSADSAGFGWIRTRALSCVWVRRPLLQLAYV